MSTFFQSFGDELEKIAAVPLRLRIADPKAFAEYAARQAGKVVSHAPAVESKALSGAMKSAPSAAAEVSHRTITARGAAPASAARPAPVAQPSSRSMPVPAAQPAAPGQPRMSLGKKLMIGGATAAGVGVGAGAANRLRKPEPMSSVDMPVA